MERSRGSGWRHVVRALRQPARTREQRPRRDRGVCTGRDGPAACDRWRRSVRLRLHRALHATTDPRVRFLGAIYGSGYRILRSHATAYVQATEVGGTHPALVEAMGFGNAIVANDVPEHRETLGDAGRYYNGAGGSRRGAPAVSLDDPGGSSELRAAPGSGPATVSAGMRSPTPTKPGSRRPGRGRRRSRPADPILAARAEDRTDHRHHRPGRLVPGRVPARRGLPRRRDDAALEHRSATSGSPTSPDRLELIQGDLLDQASLVEALADRAARRGLQPRRPELRADLAGTSRS